MALSALPASLPSVAAMPGNVKDALPALTVMMVNGAVNVLIAILILIAGWMVANGIRRWVHDLIGRSHYIEDTLKPLISNGTRYMVRPHHRRVLSQFGVQTTSLIALLGAAGLAVAWRCRAPVHVASGLRWSCVPFRVFEKIRVTDVTGRCGEIGLFRTKRHR